LRGPTRGKKPRYLKDLTVLKYEPGGDVDGGEKKRRKRRRRRKRKRKRKRKERGCLSTDGMGCAVTGHQTRRIEGPSCPGIHS
jgi:hypothetical protein